MSALENEAEQAILDAIHYINSYYNGEVAIDFIKKCVETTSRNGTLNVDQAISMIQSIHMESHDNVSNVPRKQPLSLKLAAPQLLDDQLTMLSPKTPFIHPEYPSIPMTGSCNDQILAMQALHNFPSGSPVQNPAQSTSQNSAFHSIQQGQSQSFAPIRNELSSSMHINTGWSILRFPYNLPYFNLPESVSNLKKKLQGFLK